MWWEINLHRLQRLREDYSEEKRKGRQDSSNCSESGRSRRYYGYKVYGGLAWGWGQV